MLLISSCGGTSRQTGQRHLDTLDRAVRADLAGVIRVTKADKNVCADSSPPTDDLTVTAAGSAEPPPPDVVVATLKRHGWSGRPVLKGNDDYARMEKHFDGWTGYVIVNRAATPGWLSAVTDDSVPSCN
jgi:hypothetical protein